MPLAFHYIQREKSWLSFNARVLQEAADPSVPLIERLKFLGIFSSNLDEFFRVRVAALRKLARYKQKFRFLEYDPDIVLNEVLKIVISQQKRFDKIYKILTEELAEHKIFTVNETQLNPHQTRFVTNYFQKEILPRLSPVIIDRIQQFPFLKDKSIYLAVRLSKSDVNGNFKYKHALIEIPTEFISRFVVLPKIGENKYLILLEDIIRFCLRDLFYIFHFHTYEAWTVKLTRDADLEIDEHVAGNFIDIVSKSLQKRKKGTPVRFTYDKSLPPDFLNYFVRRMHLDTHDLIPGGRYHNFKDFIKVPNIGGKDMVYEPLIQVPHRVFEPKKSMIRAIKFQDCILHLPYHSFDFVIQYLREASIDPKVKDIKITLYRVAENSNIVNSLINAVRNGKSVTVFLELQARFDEEANIAWTKKMEEEGVKVIHGTQGRKVHCKICLITREEKGKAVLYANIGTGNYHEVTARLYCDHSFFTSDKRITTDVKDVFRFLEFGGKMTNLRHLMISPLNMRNKLTALINKEIENAKLKKDARIILKLNHIDDRKLVNQLYEASMQGVKIDIIARSTCSIVPGLKKISENIRAISIVDKFLEHARIYYFLNDGIPAVYLSSSDLMYRNLNTRVEVAVPVYDKKIQVEIFEILRIQLADNTKARLISETLQNRYYKSRGTTKVRAQEDVYNFLRTTE